MRGAQVAWRRRNAYPGQIEAICVPAGLNRRLGQDAAIAVKPHILAQMFEFKGILFSGGACFAQARCEVSCTQIGAVIASKASGQVLPPSSYA